MSNAQKSKQMVRAGKIGTLVLAGCLLVESACAGIAYRDYKAPKCGDTANQNTRVSGACLTEREEPNPYYPFGDYTKDCAEMQVCMLGTINGFGFVKTPPEQDACLKKKNPPIRDNSKYPWYYYVDSEKQGESGK
ncbi:MAG: hypothetical protein ACP5NX_03165 [Candidatus Bilamarchaeaceae archaeon]